MNAARRDGLLLLLLGCFVFLLLGVALESIAPGPMSDFKAVYYGARSVMQHHDPYQKGEILRLYEQEGGKFPADPDISRSVHRAVLVCINLPTTLFLMVPFALLSWAPAHVLWMAIMAASIIFAACLIWNLGSGFAPVLSGALVCLVLVNSEVVLIIGNVAGIAISLCLVAAWCFLKDRFALAGVCCLAGSLLLKPHDAGLVWLYFLLAGGVHRKRALQTLFIVLLVAAPAFLWVWHIAPSWIQELHANLVEASARGDLNDPGPSSISAHSLAMMVSLQTLLSVFKDDPSFYNPLTHLLCAPLLLVWAWITLRTRATPERAWLALAAISALSMLPVYHRQYDCKMLLLAIPACAMLWAKGGITAWLAVGLNAAGFVLTGDVTWALILALINRLHIPPGKMLEAIQAFPNPLVLLAMGVFYLWVYARRPMSAASGEHAGAFIEA
jgi:hypothetical protein